jgi:glyoxylase-like metal-dependent hydrolase (beta-lactamase superfamily II)
MSGPALHTVVNVGYRSTNYWVVSAGPSRLLVDLGFPGTVGAMLAGLTRRDVPLAEIGYGLATHYHIDHAGAAQDLKARGMRLVVVDLQLPAVPAMARWTKPQDGYTPITLDDNVVTTIAGSRRLLAGLGLAGQIVPTPGHSDDSVSLLLDDGCAFTGDLTIPAMAEAANAEAVHRSWRRLRDLGATRVHPGHGPIYPLSRLELE